MMGLENFLKNWDVEDEHIVPHLFGLHLKDMVCA